MTTGNYNLPVSVPVAGTYGEASMLQTSPQLAHQSISPRPSSSETDSGMSSFLLLYYRQSFCFIYLFILIIFFYFASFNVLFVVVLPFYFS